MNARQKAKKYKKELDFLKTQTPMVRTAFRIKDVQAKKVMVKKSIDYMYTYSGNGKYEEAFYKTMTEDDVKEQLSNYARGNIKIGWETDPISGVPVCIGELWIVPLNEYKQNFIA